MTKAHMTQLSESAQSPPEIPPISDENWKQFFDNTRMMPPSPLLVQAVPSAASRRSALDLGSGGLRDTKYLLEMEFETVVAVDSNIFAQDIAAQLPPQRFTFVESSFEQYDFPVAAFDLVNAQFALPFTDPTHFPRVFEAILNALRPGGIFVGQLFGDRDEWAGDPKMSFHSAADAKSLVEGKAALVYFCDEEDWEGTVSSGAPKHWHIINIIARKTSAATSRDEAS